MALFNLSLLLLLALVNPAATTLIRVAAAYHRSAGSTTMLDFSVHPGTAATDPRASEVEMAGSDTGMVGAAPPRPERDGERELQQEIVLASLGLGYNSAAPLLADSPLIARYRDASIFLAAMQPASIAFCQRGGAFGIVLFLDRVDWFMVLVLYDDGIIVGGGGPLLRGGQDCVQALRARFVVGRRLCGADSLPPLADEGHPLPPLADEGQSLAVTHGPLALEEADGSAMSMQAIYYHFPLLHGWVDGMDGGANATLKDDDETGGAPATLWAIGLLPAFLIPLGNYFFGRRTMAAHRCVEIDGVFQWCQVCDNCWVRQVNWVASCCQLCLCSTCFPLVFLRRHSTDISDRPCDNPGAFGEIGVVFEKNHDYYMSSVIDMDAELIPYKSADPAVKLELRVFTRWRSLYARYPAGRTLKVKIREHNGRVRVWRKIGLAPKKCTSHKIPLIMRWLGWEE